MPSTKRAAARSPSPSPGPPNEGAASGLLNVLKARFVRYKETNGEKPFQPDLAEFATLGVSGP